MFPIRTLAIHSTCWEDPEPDEYIGFSDGTIDILWRCKVKELLIVVGPLGPLSPNTIFVEPRNDHLITEFRREILGIGLEFTFGEPFSILTNRIAEALQSYKDQRAVDRKLECESTYGFLRILRFFN